MTEVVVEISAVFAAIMSVVNLVVLACIHYNLNNNYYPRIMKP